MVLYSNDAGTESSFTLSESAANFEAMDVEYIGGIGAGNKYMTSRVFGPDGKSVQLMYVDYISGTMQLGLNTLVLSGKTATFRGYYYVNFNSRTVSDGPAAQASSNVHVTKVVGYRKLA